MPYLRVELKEVPNPLDSYLISREMNQTRSDQTVLDDAVRWKDLLAEGIFANQKAIADSIFQSVRYQKYFRLIISPKNSSFE